MNHWISDKPQYLPEFIIGGAMKCGTTSLHKILNQHPKIFIPSKETHFFDMDNIVQHSDFNFYHNNSWITQSMHKNPGLVWEWYNQPFIGKENYIKGEDSTTYLASRIAAERIAQQKKDIKMIFILRQPSLRTYSNYLHLLRTGRSIYSFEDTLRYAAYEVICRSLYKDQLEYYYRYLPKEQIKVILFEEFKQQPEQTLQEICSYLQVDYNELPKESLKTHSNKGKIPRNQKLHLKKNLILRNFGNMAYNNALPFKGPSVKQSRFFVPRVLNKLHSMINPTVDINTPIKEETKEFLDNYFLREMQGIDELVGKDILSVWFPKRK